MTGQASRRPRAEAGPASEMLHLPSGDLPVRWNRCGRARRVSLRIDPRAGTVVVTLPARAARDAGLALLRTHADWAASRLAALPGVVRFAAGASVLLCGRPHPIRPAPEARRGVWVEGGEIRVSGAEEFLPRRVADFLRAEARVRLSGLAGEIASGAGPDLSPARLVIKDTATRWGSCSSERVVMFSWRLVMAPPDVQHYVVAHELAHLRHLDHGPGFWSLVARLTPHRVQAELWLRHHGATLLRTG